MSRPLCATRIRCPADSPTSRQENLQLQASTAWSPTALGRLSCLVHKGCTKYIYTKPNPKALTYPAEIHLPRAYSMHICSLRRHNHWASLKGCARIPLSYRGSIETLLGRHQILSVKIDNQRMRYSTYKVHLP